MTHSFRLLAVATGLVAAAQLPAQRLVRDFYGPSTQSDFGSALARSVDADGDGRADLVVGAPGTDTTTLVDVGAAYLVSTANGALLTTALGPAAAARMGTRVLGPGDLNGDGAIDLVFAGPLANNQNGTVQAIGSNGTVLWSRYGWAGARMGSALAFVRDMNGDGGAEIMVSTPATVSTTFGYVGSFASQTGQPLTAVNGSSNGQWGASMVTLGDIDGDGDDDVACSEPLFAGGIGRVSLIRPITGGAASVYWTTGAAFAAGDNVGYVMGNAGDLTGDGKNDLLVSSTQARVYLIDGANGGTIGFVSHPVYANATSLCGIGDQNGDGVPEFAIGQAAHNSQAGRVAVHDGATRNLLYLLDGAPGSRFGASMVALGDVDGDGLGEFAVGAPTHSSGGIAIGRVAIFGQVIPSQLASYGLGCGGPGGLLQLAASGLAIPGQTVMMTGSNLPVLQLGALMLGASSTTSIYGPLPLDLSVIGMGGCSLLQSMEIVDPFVTTASTIARPLPLPNDYAFVGFRLYTQLLMLDPLVPAGLTTSNGVRVRIGNQ
jgi:hypothetical protein